MTIHIEMQLAVREGIDGTILVEPRQVENYLSAMRELAQEMFVVLTMNTKNQVIARHMISLGTVNSALVHPREVFRPAISDGSASIILAHNHPSGDPAPSAEDLKITRQLIEAGKHIGINVIDHLIIGDRALSLRESGLCVFN